MKKEALAADAWLKEVAPSTELRRWFGHRVERWEEFRRRYRKELHANPSAWVPLLEADGRGTVTLLYSAHDVLHNGAVVLLDYLEEQRARHPHRVQREEDHRKEVVRIRTKPWQCSKASSLTLAKGATRVTYRASRSAKLQVSFALHVPNNKRMPPE
jgi:uncharacterized protein YeaO (DUF488 family)